MISKWFQLLLYKNILWGTFLKITCFWRVFLPKSLPENGDITFIQFKWLHRTLFKTMQRNTTKPVTLHEETRLVFCVFWGQKNKLQTSNWIYKCSIKFFFQEPGKQFVLFYRTSLKSFLAEFLFHNQNNSREVTQLFFRDFFFSGQSLVEGEREREKNLANSKTTRQKLHTMGKTSKIVINYSVTKLKYWWKKSLKNVKWVLVKYLHR